jgi:hypothetical protein
MLFPSTRPLLASQSVHLIPKAAKQGGPCLNPGVSALLLRAGSKRTGARRPGDASDGQVEAWLGVEACLPVRPNDAIHTLQEEVEGQVVRDQVHGKEMGGALVIGVGGQSLQVDGDAVGGGGSFEGMSH